MFYKLSWNKMTKYLLKDKFLDSTKWNAFSDDNINQAQMMILTLSQTSPGFYMSAIKVF